ncbi:MAG: hypothetical protein IKX28_00690 [Bacteroidales bacterium]|nr:hypothetical protein [Bacteroidales bacterium]
MTFFLITTDHLETRLWFRDDEDFKTAMNYVAIVAYALGIDILAFILMSNHVHFILSCFEEEARRFITEFKRLFSHYLSRKYQTREQLRENGVDIQPLVLGDESLERAIAYVQMNCVAANVCINSADYPWGTGNCFFRAAPDKGRRLGDISRRAQVRLLHSKQELPSGWVLGEEGYILPGSYVNIGFVESLFRSPKRMNFFLQNSSKAKQRLALREMDLPSFRDQIILPAISDLCQSLFHKREIKELDEEQLPALIAQIRRRFNADAKQIARVTGIPYQEIARMLQAF